MFLNKIIVAHSQHGPFIFPNIYFWNFNYLDIDSFENVPNFKLYLMFSISFFLLNFLGFFSPPFSLLNILLNLVFCVDVGGIPHAFKSRP